MGLSILVSWSKKQICKDEKHVQYIVKKKIKKMVR